MSNLDKNKQVFKILFAAAWIDGVIQKEEREYLQTLAKEQNLSEDGEIKLILSEAKPITPEECHNWLEDYLGNNPSVEDHQNLLEAISAIIYKDGDIQTQEAQLLSELQSLEPTLETRNSAFDKILRTIQKLYRQAVSEERQ
jgi:uncharacterized tellurite resistance protein B-like protein